MTSRSTFALAGGEGHEQPDPLLPITGDNNPEETSTMKLKLATCAAALLCAGAASAQSTVTLYGIIDVNLSRFSSGSRSGVGDQTAMVDGTTNGLNGSRWGLRTVEDLGGGMKASVVAEAGINADTGVSAQGGLAFGRQIFVSLSSAQAGELRLGRQYAAHDVVMGYNNPFGNALVLNPGIGVTNTSRSLPQFIDAPRINNMVRYSAPRFGGVEATLHWAPGENTADRYAAVMLQYGAGNLAAALSHEWNKDRTTGDKTNKVTTVGANYDFGPAKLWGGWQQGRSLTTSAGNVGGLSNLVVTGPFAFTAKDLDVYTVAVSAPFGAFLVGANYTRTTYESATGQKLNLGKAAVGLRYALSNRTFLYTGLSKATGDLKDYISQEQVFQLGVRTAF
jgi:predicted porin